MFKTTTTEGAKMTKTTYLVGGKATTANSDTLYRSDSGETATAEDLGITEEEYETLCQESDDSGTSEGHVVTSTGVRVYAST